MRILVAEDDAILADGLVHLLNKLGYAVDSTANGEQASHMLQSGSYNLLILDLGLPRLDGFTVLQKMRQAGNTVPVLILTAQAAMDDRVRGLNLGADDYMTKPFSLEELTARVKALIRRGQMGSNAALRCGRVSYDASTALALCDDRPLELSSRELGLLELLLLRQNRVVSKEQIMEALCSWDESVGENAIEVYVHRLRKKLEASDVQIRTVRGMGYLLEAV